ncbi:hypothetical protein [Pseudomonas sp.]|uniref:hypothetical protein n=1 Tax=Pseudomonas sp. TaxID=306 RepID=UPI003D0B21FA
MADERIVIYPFEQYKDFQELRYGWGLARLQKQKKYPERKDLPDYEFYTFDKSSVKKLKAKISGWVSSDVVIYIVGHCNAGSRFLSRRDDPSGQTIAANALADELLNLGLSTDFAGKIKVYACNSAVPDGKKFSFAFWFAAEMRALKYLNCEISGYANVVSNSYVGEHKVSADEGVIDKLSEGDVEAVNKYRAKNSRESMNIPPRLVELIEARRNK